MSAKKRGRPVADDGELEFATARSSLRQDTRKRARISEKPTASEASRAANGGHHYHDQDDVSEVADDESQDDDRGIDPRVHHSDDEENEELDTQRATQLIRRRNGTAMDNMPAEHGIIESVTCTNFMCHAKLHVPLGPLINFIIGHNGSGKSAVLTALTLCLGAKASSTNRGQNLKSFVKEGQEHAVLAVKIKNTGNNGFQQDVYGDSVIVERHFSKAGASSFKLKSASGRLISSKKADLDEVLDFYGLQLDNPMNVLTQDMARQFLSNSSPADKYRFFLKGVQLEQLDQDYQLLEEIIDQNEAQLASNNDQVQVLEAQALKAATRLAMSDKHESLRSKLRSYARQMAWAQVEEQEQVRQKIDDEIRGADVRINEAEHKVGTANSAFEQATEYLQRAQSTVNELKEGLTPLEDGRAEIRDRFNKNKTDLIGVQTDHRNIRSLLTGVTGRIDKANNDIATEKQRLEDANGGSHARRYRELENTRQRAAEAKAEFNRHVEGREGLENELRRAKAEAHESAQPIEAKKAEIRQCEDTIRSLVRNQGQHIEAFHERMPVLLRAIRNEPGFLEQPVGPIGNHVRLLKPEWSSILEKSFGATLSSFIVTSKQDQTLLSNLMRRVNCNCQILIGNNRPIDVSNNEPDSQFDTTLRVLEIDNELVRRQLIIGQAIEQTILIQSWKDATNVMYDGPKPRNVKQCFCLHNTRRGYGMRLAYARGTEASSSPMPPMTGRPRMKTDSESQINYHRENLRHLERELKELEARATRLYGDVQTCDQAIARHKRQESDLRHSKQQIEDEAEKLQDELERDSVQDGRLEALLSGLKEVEEEKTLLERQYEEAVLQKERLNETASKLNVEIKTLDGAIAEENAKIKKAERKVSTLEQARYAALQAKNQAIQDIEDAKYQKQRVEEKRQGQAELVDGWTAQASKVCTRVPIDAGETAQSLDKKLERLNRDLERYEKDMGASRETIAQQAAEAQIALQAAKAQVKDSRTLIQILKQSLVDRQEKWRMFRRFISARARAQFTYLLSERGFHGRLNSNHRRRLLDLQVEPDETRTGAGRQTKTLSGGEKSFSTICLLLSLWEAMGSPIRCLDEFDVFMDNVNRDVSLRMMITAARRSTGKQFILITPQSMGNVDVAGDVKIIKLSDPERGQTTISFGS